MMAGTLAMAKGRAGFSHLASRRRRAHRFAATHERRRVGDAAEFRELTAEELAFVELKLALANHLREIRLRGGWTQTEIAQRLGSSQSRVAKMEAADGSVSVDLLVKSLLSLGATRGDVGRVVGEAA